MQFFLCSSLLTLLFASSVHASVLHVQELEAAEWHVESNPFACRLSQSIQGIGTLAFLIVPKSQVKIRFTPSIAYKLKDINLSAQHTELKPANIDYKIASLTGHKSNHGHISFSGSSEPLLEERLLQEISQGNSLRIDYSAGMGRESVLFPSIYGQRSVSDFRHCIDQMSPLSWQHARHTEFSFHPNQTQITVNQKQVIADISRYLTFDNTVSRLLIDGHSDDAGGRLANRMLSQERADEVATMLIEQGISKKMLEVRAHGNRYPRNEAHKTQPNRRVTVRLVRTIK